jgi:NTE family protein
MKKKAIIVLGGGAALGLAHIGALAAIEKKFSIAGIVGTSMGSIIGGMYACGVSTTEMLEIAKDFRKVEMFNPFNLDMTFKGIFDGKSTLKKLKEWTEDKDIRDAKIPFIAVAYDLNSSSSVLIDSGKFADAMRASSSVPYFFAPYEWGKYDFVDGGVEHPLPLAFTSEFNLKAPVIAVNVLPKVSFRTSKIDLSSRRPKEKPGLRLNQVFLQSVMQNQGFIALQALINHCPDLIIDANHPELNVMDFNEGEKFYDYGYRAASQAIEQFKEPDFLSGLLKSYLAALKRIEAKA